MGSEVFQLTTLGRALGDEVELLEAIGFPEISAFDDTERKRSTCLAAKARMLLEEANGIATIHLHRRRLVRNVEIKTVEVLFEPPRRNPEWETAVRLPVHYACWNEGDLYQAFVPVLGVQVFAPRAELLPERIEAHLRLLLTHTGRGRFLTLGRLAELARTRELMLGQVETTASRKTPKQLEATSSESTTKESTLGKMAEELPPVTTPAAAQPMTATAAWEMESELALLAENLSGPHRRSVLLVGPSGCGKTALVRELARRRADFGFGSTAFWTTSAARLMSGPIGFGMWQERCEELCREAARTHCVLHLNNLAELLEVGKVTRGGQSVGAFLRPWIARGEVLAIVECTPAEISAIERQDPHLLGAFLELKVEERSPAQTRSVLGHAWQAAPGQAPASRVVTETALDRAQQLHQRYATYSASPGRPLRFLRNLLADRFPDKLITEAEVIAAFSRETGLPAVLLDDALTLDLESTRGWFERRVIGQPDASASVVDLLAVIKARLARPRKPLASLLFIGPTGTGKTEMAKSLAEFLFGDSARLVRFDLNEYGDPVSVLRLIGGPGAGDAEGLLTARIREQPFSVVLLDEFEKADPAFFDLLLQILGDGRLTDASGRVADFCNSVIVMTSNLGAQGFQRGPTGFRGDRSVADTQEHFSSAVRKFLRPEIYNRLDAILPFRPLTQEIVHAIAQRHVELIRQRDGIRLRKLEWSVAPEVAAHLAARGYDARYGARPLKRATERELLVPLAEALNAYQPQTPLTVEAGVENGRIQFKIQARPEAASTEREIAGRLLAQAITDLRRRVGRLRQSRAMSQIEDELAVLTALERRLKVARWKNPEVTGRLAKLPALRKCIAAAQALAGRTAQLESDALSSLFQGEPPEEVLFRADLTAARQECTRLTQEAFRQQLDAPDAAVLAIYSEHAGTLFEFARVYHSLAKATGEVVALDYYTPPPEGRSKEERLVRQTPKDAAVFLREPPEKVTGILMQVRGPLFGVQFNAEAGLHIVRERKVDRVCLVESSPVSFTDYKPGAGIELPGGIRNRNATDLRTYDRVKHQIDDSVIGKVERVEWDLHRAVSEMMRQRLEKAIEQATS